MTVIAVGSVHGSPGASTLALDLARHCGDGSLVIELDPDGGTLAARLDLAIRPGLTELAGAARVGIEFDDVWNYAQPIDSGVAVVIAHPAAEQTQAALRAAAHHICAAIGQVAATSSVPVIVDVGRLRPGSLALCAATSADHTLVMSHNSVEAVVALTHRRQLLSTCGAPIVVLNLARPYPAADIAAASQQQVWGTCPAGGSRRDQRRRYEALDRLIGDLLRPASLAAEAVPDVRSQRRRYVPAQGASA